MHNNVRYTNKLEKTIILLIIPHKLESYYRIFLICQMNAIIYISFDFVYQYNLNVNSNTCYIKHLCYFYVIVVLHKYIKKID